MNRQQKRNNNKKEKKQMHGSKNSINSYRNDKIERSSTRTIDPKDASNDPAWYAQDSALMRDSASIPWSWTTGTNFNLYEESNYVADQPEVIPGICALYLAPTAGEAQDDNSPLNVACANLFSFLRHTNSGTRPWDKMDLGIYYLCMSDIYSYVVFLKRVYKAAFMSFQQNRYFPDALLYAMGVNANSVKNNLANFRYAINAFINKVTSLAVPNNLPFFARKAFLYSNIYCGGESLQDQIYLYVPHGFWQFSITTQDDVDNYGDSRADSPKPAVGAGMLRFKPFTAVTTSGGDASDTHFYNWDQLIEYGEEMLAAIVNDGDINLMSADTLRAFGSSGVITVSELAEFEALVPVFNIEVLNQMKNAVVLPVSGYSSNAIIQNLDLNVYQSIPSPTAQNKSGFLLTDYHVGISNVTTVDNNPLASVLLATRKRLLTTKTPDTTPELTMVATRLQPSFMGTSTIQQNDALFFRFGSEVCVQCCVYAMENPVYSGITKVAPLLDYFQQFYSDYAPYKHLRYANVSYGMDNVIATLCFEFAPQAWWYVTKDENTMWPLSSIIPGFNIDKYAIITNAELSRLHETALLSMLNVPNVAKAYNR